MSQGFQKVELTDSLKDSLPKLMSNDEAAISCNAAASFPTKNLKDGMLCFRTDEKKLYQRRGSDWVQLAEGGSVDEAIKAVFATDAETKAGTVSDKAVTPANLKQFMNAGQLGDIISKGSNYDLNTAIKSGNYWVDGTGQVNGPCNTAGLLRVYVRNGNWILQDFVSSGKTENQERVQDCWHRMSVDGGATWSVWVTGTPASEEERGTVKLATADEVKTGTDSAKAITPKALKEAGIGEVKIDDATELIKGIVELATSDEVTTGTDGTRAVTPKSLKDAGIVKVDLSKYLPLTGGTVTGATTFTGSLKSGSSGNLNLSTKLISEVRISGRTITFTFNDGSTQNITTQDTVTTNTSNWTVQKGTNGWARDNSTQLTFVWGRLEANNSGWADVTFSRTFSSTYAAFVCVYRKGSAGEPQRNYSSVNTITNSGMNIGHDSDAFWLVIGLS